MIELQEYTCSEPDEWGRTFSADKIIFFIISTIYIYLKHPEWASYNGQPLPTIKISTAEAGVKVQQLADWV